MDLRVESGVSKGWAAISWAQFEPVEGKFDYTLVEGIIREARSNGLHLVLLWSKLAGAGVQFESIRGFGYRILGT